MAEEEEGGLERIIRAVRGEEELRGLIRQTFIIPFSFRLGEAFRVAGQLAQEGISYTPDLMASDIEQAIRLARAREVSIEDIEDYPPREKFVKGVGFQSRPFLYQTEVEVVHTGTGERFVVPVAISSDVILRSQDVINRAQEILERVIGTGGVVSEALADRLEEIVGQRGLEGRPLSEFVVGGADLSYVQYTEEVEDLIDLLE